MKQPTRTGTAFYSPEQGESFVSLLVGLDLSRRMAYVVVFLAHVPGSTACDIATGTSLGKNSVYGALLNLEVRGWVYHRRVSNGKHAVKVFTNVLSIKDIAYLLRKEKYAREGEGTGE